MATTIGSLDLNAFSDLYSDSTQYFWFESNASATYGAGAHVTLVPDTSFISNPTGQNILMNTDGFSIRNGLLPMMTLDNDSLDFNVVNTTAGTYTTTATFTATGAQIGQSSGAHSIIDADGQRFYASDGTTQLANIGYGEGEAQTGTTIAPYYTFGTRVSNSTVGNYSMAEGYGMTASGTYSHAEGLYTTASGTGSHAEGLLTTASGTNSHAEGHSTKASGTNSHAEGHSTKASGTNSHAEGLYTTASGTDSHAEGHSTTASGESSHAGGCYTIAQRKSQTVIGEYNIADEGGTDKTTQGYYAFIIGNGYVDTQSLTVHKSNALTVDWNGRVTGGDMSSSEITEFINSIGTPTGNLPVDWIVEEGVSGIWTYRKWNSGFVDMWGVSTDTEAPYTTTAQYGYWYPHNRIIDFPFPISYASGSYSVFCGSAWGIPGAPFPYSHDDSQTPITSSRIYALASNSSTIKVTYKIQLHGRWK